MTKQDIIAAIITFTLFGALFGWATARWADVELAPQAIPEASCDR